MSESVQVAKRRSANPKETSQSPKILMATAALTMITTLGAAFIGIVPQLMRGKDTEIKKLNEELTTTRQNAASGATAKDNAPPTPKQNIHGTVMSEDGKRPLNGVEVYLVPNGHDQLTTKTADSGEFDFRGIPDGVYSIIVRDSAGGKSGRGLLVKQVGEVNVIGAKIKYSRGP
jgi:Carboxypeptidase regulatory-like domain